MKYNITFGDTVCIHTYYGVILREEFTIGVFAWKPVLINEINKDNWQ